VAALTKIFSVRRSAQVIHGDKVTTGQAIGSMGFSGESAGPHLHFHVADANSPLDTEDDCPEDSEVWLLVPYGAVRLRRIATFLTSMSSFQYSCD